MVSVSMHTDVLSTKHFRVHAMTFQVWFGDISLKERKEKFDFSIIQTSFHFPLGVTVEVTLLSIEDDHGIITQHPQRKVECSFVPLPHNSSETRDRAPAGFTFPLL